MSRFLQYYFSNWGGSLLYPAEPASGRPRAAFGIKTKGL